MSRLVGGVINLMYFRYEKFKKWITQQRLGLMWAGFRSGAGRGWVVAACRRGGV
jgi:hypothetical protein